MTKSSVDEYTSDPNNKRVFLQERAILEVTTRLEEAMEQQGVSRAELARRLGKTKGWVTQLLDGEANKTVRTIADAFAVLGQAYRCYYEPAQISNAVQPSAITASVLGGLADKKLRQRVSASTGLVMSVHLKIAG